MSTSSPSGSYSFAKRLLDALVALVLLILASPVLALLLPWLLFASKSVIRSEEFVGVGGRTMRMSAFTPAQWQVRTLGRWSDMYEYLPRLFALLGGRLTLVGPRPITPDELPLFGGIDHGRFTAVPGVVCLWWLRKRGNIDYGTESAADLEYLTRQSLRRDLAILARSLIALAYGAGASTWDAGHYISGIRLLNVSMDNLLDAIVSALDTKTQTRIAFVNPDCVNIAAANARYRLALDHFDWVCADGIGMKIAGNLLGRPVRQNLNGTDLYPRLCAELAASGHSLYLLGARPGVADEAARWAVDRYPTLRVAGTHSGYFSEAEEPAVLAKIRATGAQVLLVAMGAPRQELWLQRNLDATGALVGMGVGGLFDFYSGRIKRAPQWLREIGGEWAYRLLQEPGRMWRRYLVGNWTFLMRIIVEKFSGEKKKGPVT
jgi:N-acetylglucosaminyldiphosphoundecaprenol N-acetyl-beta-D-mannosaminyltransferase